MIFAPDGFQETEQIQINAEHQSNLDSQIKKQPERVLETDQTSKSPANSDEISRNSSNGVSNIWSQPLSGEAAKQLTDFTTEQILFFDWSDDNQLVCSRGVTTQEAVLISNFR